MNRQNRIERLPVGHCHFGKGGSDASPVTLLLPLAAVAIAILIPIGSSFGAEAPAAKAPPETESAESATGENAETPQDQSRKTAPKSEKPTDTDKPKERNSDLDRQLLRDLLPDLTLPADSATTDPEGQGGNKSESRSRVPLADELDEAVAAMREVSRRLDKRNLSDETADLQTGIVSNIDALIEKLRNLPPPSSSESGDPSDDDQQLISRKKTTRKQTQKTQGQKTPQDQQGSGSRPSPQPQTGKAGESTEKNLRKARQRATALARRRALIDEVWGHLPPAMRDRLLNVGSDKLLPKYEDMIRRYYESLAEPDRAGSRRPANAGF